MKRREFLKLGVSTLAVAGVPTLSDAAMGTQSQTGSFAPRSQEGGILPRKVELIDNDWLFSPDNSVIKGTDITDWQWIAGTPDQESTILGPDAANLTGWQTATLDDNTLQPNSYGWFRASLPEITGARKVIHFTGVDDNGTVFLNGKKLLHHEGWSSPFTVELNSAWKTDGPNEVVVLVHNIGGAGGLIGPIVLGVLPPEQDCSNPAFNDSKWRKVHLPHDYIVEGKFTPTADAGHGSLPVYPAWYRKHLTIPTSDKGKSIWLYFEGIFRSATIYLNGKQIHFQSGGYDSFHVNIEPYVHFGKDNLLAIHVDPTDFEGWWYEGGGIYRHVWLNVANKVHVSPWGVYATSVVHDVLGKPSAEITVQTHLLNQSNAKHAVRVTSTILAPDGKQVGSTSSVVHLLGASEHRLKHTISLSDVLLWSLEERHLYKVITAVEQDGEIIDRHEQRFGIRTIRFDPAYGFFLNEQPVKLKGTCNHQDFVGVGIGMPDSILYWRMSQLKEKLGCNAIRCSHNPMTPAMYNACDELGLLVMDEIRHPGSAPEQKASVGTPYSNTWHVESMVLRDRNHPSVIMWSLSNEEWAVQGNAYGAKMFTALMRAVHKHDTTRPCTSAMNEGPDEGWMLGYATVEDVLGVNYNYEDYDYLRKKYPNKMIFGSETASDVSCRGIYKTNDIAAHVTSMMSPQGSWQPLGSRKFVAGGFVWTGFDYRGEPTPYGWPEINSNFGLLDVCGFPKDDAFYYRAWWKPEEPLVHIFPHWNWAGKEGQNVPIWCFSNCDQVELFLNGVSLGAQTMPEFGHLQWDNVTYTPGELEARGYLGGIVVTTDVVKTTGAPAALKLTAGRSTLYADGEDIVPVEVSVVDANGLVVPIADNMVHFSVTGAATNGGVGNGDPSSHEPNQADYRSAFNGLCMVLVRADTSPGSIELTATSAGLSPARLRFEAKA